MQRCICMLSHVQFFGIPWRLYSLSWSSGHGILQARILKWIAISYSSVSSRASSQPRDQTCSHSCLPHWQVGSLTLPHLGSPSTQAHLIKLNLLRKTLWRETVIGAKHGGINSETKHRSLKRKLEKTERKKYWREKIKKTTQSVVKLSWRRDVTK